MSMAKLWFVHLVLLHDDYVCFMVIKASVCVSISQIKTVEVTKSIRLLMWFNCHSFVEMMI